MRIFYAVARTANSRFLTDSSVWRNNLYLALVDLGAEMVEFQYDLVPHARQQNPDDPKQKAFIDENRRRLEEELLKQVFTAHKKKPIDVFFSYFSNAFVRPDTVRRIRGLGILTVNWYCNASFQFHCVAEIAPAYDYCLVPEKFRLEDYRRIGASPIYTQEAANPNVYKPYPVEREYDVTFVGQKYGNREEYLVHLHNAGVDVRAWGPGWIPGRYKLPFLARVKMAIKAGNFWKAVRAKKERALAKTGVARATLLPIEKCGPALSDEDMVKMYSRSKISLGFSVCGETYRTEKPVLQVRLRDFEAPMSGAFYMVEYMEEIEEFFEVGKEIVCYFDKEDLADKVKYYLAHEDERENIRLAGHTRALRDHTWQKRLRAAFAGMALDVPGQFPRDKRCT